MARSTKGPASAADEHFRMPAEWEPHARCFLAWPDRADLWGEALPATQQAYANVARAIRTFEPVTMIANPASTTEAQRLCGPTVEVVPIAVDDAWLRDTGPAFLVGTDGGRAAAAWRFNGWGGSFPRFARDAEVAAALCEYVGVPLRRSELCFEGGGITVDGDGTAITTESCVLNPNRNPGWTKPQVEAELRRLLGVEKVIWLPGELWEGDCTDGHVDGLACFVRPGQVLVECRTAPGSEREDVLEENRRVLERATDARGRKLDVVEMEDAWQAEVRSEQFCASYVNFYIANGGIVMPAYDAPGDEPARKIVAQAFPAHRVVQVDVRDIAICGGGIHCITQQQPARNVAAVDGR